MPILSPYVSTVTIPFPPPPPKSHSSALAINGRSDPSSRLKLPAAWLRCKWEGATDEVEKAYTVEPETGGAQSELGVAGEDEEKISRNGLNWKEKENKSGCGNCTKAVTQRQNIKS